MLHASYRAVYDLCLPEYYVRSDWYAGFLEGFCNWYRLRCLVCEVSYDTQYVL